MEIDLNEYINNSLLTDEFFNKIDHIAKFEGEEILMKHDRFCLKNLGSELIQNETPEFLKKMNEIFKNMFPDHIDNDFTFTSVKKIEIKNVNACVPFDYIYIQIPLIHDWWKEEQMLKRDLFECKIFMNNKLSNNFIILDSVFGNRLTPVNYIDRIILFSYLDRCLDVFC